MSPALRCARLIVAGATMWHLTLIISTQCASAEGGYSHGPVPQWVEEKGWDEPIASAQQVSEGIHILLYDRQIDFTQSEVESYTHWAQLLVDEVGVREGSRFEIDFDPSYEAVVLHAVRVHRDGQDLDRLDLNRVELLQREVELEALVYNGTKTLLLIIEDVRKGDVVEVSYTIRGWNPVYAGHFSLSLLQQWDAPFGRLYQRMIYPRSRPLNIQSRGLTVEPRVEQNAESLEYVWESREVPPILPDDYLPDWYEPYPWIQVSDFTSWAELARWGYDLFDVPDTWSASSHATLDQLWAKYEDDPQRIMACLRWVQDEVRYLAVETGLNSHQPSEPAEVLRRRYGDCKDKSVLLASMLRSKGIEAYPALVNTQFREHITGMLPAIGDFDHALVCVKLGSGQYWLDPSSILEGGDLESRRSSIYGAALVLAPNTEQLTTIPAYPNDEPSIDIRMEFALESPGQGATLKVTTVYLDGEADNLRYFIGSRTRSETAKMYLNYYANQYPSIRERESPQIEDDLEANRLVVVEQYEIPEFWGSSGESGQEGEFFAMEIAAHVDLSTSADRFMPLGVPHPTHIRYVCEASMEDGWFIQPEDLDVASPAATFVGSVRSEDTVLTLQYEYTTIADHVPAAEVAEHLSSLRAMNEFLVFSISSGIGSTGTGDLLSSDEINWPILLLSLLVVAVSAWLALRIYRGMGRDTSSDPMAPPQDPLPLQSWLLLLAMGMALQPIVLLTTSLTAVSSYSLSTWTQLTTPGEPSYHPLWAPILIFEIAGNVLMITLTILLAVTFFKRRAGFPRLFLIVQSCGCAIWLIDGLLAGAIPGIEGFGVAELGDFIVRVISVVIWSVYLFRSDRAKRTFVRG